VVKNVEELLFYIVCGILMLLRFNFAVLIFLDAVAENDLMRYWLRRYEDVKGYVHLAFYGLILTLKIGPLLLKH
jgi:hypothetical protein